jgi:YbbR domain-containing protein
MKRLFKGNTSLKIASVFIAVGLWFFINSRGVSEITITVPLEISNLPKGYEMVANKANEINLGLRGPERLIKGIRIQDIRVFLDLSKPKEGWGIYYINKDNIKFPPSIEIMKIDPSVIKLKIDRTIQKDVLVKPEVRGTPAEGTSVVSVSVKPRTISVEGAKSILEKINQLRTETIDVTGRSSTFEEDAFVITDGENVRTATEKVRVKISIAKEGK